MYFVTVCNVFFCFLASEEYKLIRTYRRSHAPPTRFSGALAVWGGSAGYMSRVHMRQTGCLAPCSTCSNGKVAVGSLVCVRLSRVNLEVSEVSRYPHAVFRCFRGVGRVCRVHEPSPHAKKLAFRVLVTEK